MAGTAEREELAQLGGGRNRHRREGVLGDNRGVDAAWHCVQFHWKLCQGSLGWATDPVQSAQHLLAVSTPTQPVSDDTKALKQLCCQLESV